MFLFPLSGLVIFTLNGGHGHHGVICKTETDTVIIYGFAQKKAYRVKPGFYLPFTPTDYQVMCDKNYWEGLLVKPFTQNVMQVTAGRKYVWGFDYEVAVDFYPSQNGYRPWLPLRWFTPCGHINA